MDEEEPPPIPEKYRHLNGQVDEEEDQPPLGRPERRSRFSFRFAARPPSQRRDEYEARKEAQRKIQEKREARKEDKEGGRGVMRMASTVGGKMKKQVQEKHAIERMMVFSLAISLLWITSLGVCREIVGYFVESPALYEGSEGNDKSVEGSLNLLFDTTLDQREAFETCANNRANECNATFNNQIVAESARVDALLDANDATLELYREVRGQCTKNSTEVNRLIDYLDSNGVSLTSFFFPGKTSDPNCTAISSTVERELVAATAYDFATAQSETATDTFNEGAAQLANRIAYDLAYIDSNQADADVIGDSLNAATVNSAAFLQELNNTYGGLWSCIDIQPGIPCNTGVSPLDNVQAQIFGTYDTYNTQYEVLRAQLEDYYQQALDKQAQYEAIYNFITSPSVFAIAVAIVPGLSGISFNSLDVSGIDLYLSTEFSVVVPNPTFPGEFDQVYVGGHEAELGALTTNMVVLESQLRERQDNLGEEAYGDYNPPPVEPNQTDPEKFASFPDDVADDLGYVPPQVLDPTDAIAINQTAVESASNLVSKVDPREWDLYAYGSSVFESFNTGVGKLEQYALLFDYTYRILRSIMLIRKYWNISAVSTPPADVRTRYGVRSGLYKERRNILQIIGSILTNPVFNLILFCAIGGIITASLYVAFEPIYSQYTASCVQNNYVGVNTNPEVDGTMVYRNALTVATNYAYTDGDQIAIESIDTLNVQRELVCRTEFDESLTRRNFQTALFNALNTDQELASVQFDAFTSCIDLAAMDAAYQNAVPPALSFNGTSIEELASNIICRASFQPIDLSDRVLHNCSAVEACEFDCDGPPEALMQATSHRAACTFEWYVQAFGLSSFFSPAVFLIVNVSRLFFMRGIVRVWWRHLTVDRFSYLATCTEEGQLIYPEEVTVDGMQFRDVISDKLRISLRTFEREGWFEMIFAILMNVPWIVLLASLRTTLAYPF